MSVYADSIPVSVENFVRAETDLYFGNVVKEGGFGRFFHLREPSPIEKQDIVRMNRDTLYSGAVFDLDAGPVAITLPDAGKRFMAMEVLSEDEYVPEVVYSAGRHTYTREDIGTRYLMVIVRTLVNPDDPADVKTVHTLQDAIRIEQTTAGKFEPPNWDPASQKQVRDALLVLSDTLPDSRHMFGSRDAHLDPVRHLIGAASGWGGNPEKEATYLNFVPAQNDGKTVHRLNVRDVPVDGFWSVIVYDAKGYIPKNDRGVYSFNNLTAKKDPDGSVTIQFGGDPAKAANCIPIVPGWNYIVRLYRPHDEILSGKWKFPQAEPLH